MKKLILSSISLLCFVSLFAQGETALINAVKAKLAKVKTYQASGVMSVDAAFIKAPPSAVTVYYKSPDKFTIKKGDGLSILPKGGISINLATLLGGTNTTAVAAGTTTLNGVPLQIVKMLPLDANSSVILSTLYIDAKKALIQKAQVTTRDNGSYEMDFAYGKAAAWGLPDKVVFTFNTREYKIPKGLTLEYDKGDTKKVNAGGSNTGKVIIQYNNYVVNKGVDDKVFGK